MKNLTVNTERLRVRPRTLAEMEALREEEQDAEMRKAYSQMLAQMRRAPADAQWATNWIICLRESGAEVGGVGFKGAPDAAGRVEIGYGIDQPYRRRGYATEAAGALVQWALAQEGVLCVQAQTEEDNLVSQRVLHALGFTRNGRGEEGPLFELYRK